MNFIHRISFELISKERGDYASDRFEAMVNRRIKKVEVWEKDQSDLWFWEKLGRLPFKFIDKWTPTFIQNKIGTLLDELGQYIQSGGSYLSSSSKIPSYYPKLEVQTLEDVKQLPISKMDNAVEGLTKNRKKLLHYKVLVLELVVFLHFQLIFHFF